MSRLAYVTGANGLVGLNLVEELARQGWDVIALHRPAADIRHLERLPARRVIGDITDPSSLARTMPAGVDTVFHVAGDTSIWRGHRVRQDAINIDGTRHVVTAALAAGARRLVHTSSISAWGLFQGAIDESAPQRGGESPINYQRSKFAGEQEVRRGIERGLDATILNPAAIIGRYDTRNYARLFRMVAQGTLPGVPTGALSICHAIEVARAHVAAADRGRCGENYLLGGADSTIIELVRVIGTRAGRPVPRRPTPPWLLHLVAFANEARARFTGAEPALTLDGARLMSAGRRCDCGKAIRELGYRPATLEVMVDDCYTWMQAEGELAKRG